MPTPVPIDAINFVSSVQVLDQLNVLPVIVLGAVVFVARILYKSFRR